MINFYHTPVFIHIENGPTLAAFCQLPSTDLRLQEGHPGELAFTTGMSGYQETITDPSFLGQHIIFSTAHVGNYESNQELWQSSHTHASSIIARNFTANQFLKDLDIPLITLEDTRALIRQMTALPSHRAIINLNQAAPSAEDFKKISLKVNDLASVSRQKLEIVKEGDRPICLIDFGCKKGIVEHLKELPYPLKVFPHNTSAQEVKSHNPRLIFLSNGPGDPRELMAERKLVEDLLSLNIPLRGICLGHQLLALALGLKIIRLPFGQRGMNHPVWDLENKDILITSQNHGYAISDEGIKDKGTPVLKEKSLLITGRSLFDNSIEAMATTDQFLRSVQYHPEAFPGPLEGARFFHEIETFLESNPSSLDPEKMDTFVNIHDKKKPEVLYKKVLLIGSGPIKIGQASEFDYSGTQALKSLKELGVDVVLLNSNPATIMTDPEMAFKTYIEPITKDVIEKIIQAENVDGLLSTMGGQTALNACLELEENGFLKENGVELLGAKAWTIKHTEDRDLFAKELDQLGFKTGKRFRAQNKEEAIQLALNQVNFPLIIRRDFALGGKGAALVSNESELREVLTGDIHYPLSLEKSLLGWKEIELEVMVDREKNGVIICSIENIDPCGVHTGDSITVAPAQTISDRCYQNLRTISLTVAKHMGVVAGGANVQFAINPQDEDDIIVIEMNPRVSRSSALASKATGYPVAKISAQLAVGLTLKDILNDITKASPVAFEPSLDYVAVKIPLFPFNKFPTSSKTLGPQMRSVGEVLGLGGNFCEAMMKALRSLEIGLEIPELSQLKSTPIIINEEYIRNRLQTANELSVVTVLEALRLGITKEEIFQLSQITPWFINQIEKIYFAEEMIKKTPLLLKESTSLKKFKGLGLSDKHLALLGRLTQKDILQTRLDYNIHPSFKAVDTCSGEFSAKTPYFYSTFACENEAVPLQAFVILGSGPNRIGQGIEFDYSCVKSSQYLRSNGHKAILINSNPETVSTDYDSSDRLYLAPLYSEDLWEILNFENPKGVIACFSGQTGIKIRHYLETGHLAEFKKFSFLGPELSTLDLTEDRAQFGKILEQTSLSKTRYLEVSGHKHLINAMLEIGFPVIIRPNYVIGGESMYIFNGPDDLGQLPTPLLEELKKSTITFQVENYLENALEYDVDLIRDHQGHTIFTVCEHIEHAGVHSGDSGMITPPVVLTSKLYAEMKSISQDLANRLNVVGPINFQYAVKDGDIYCIEANPRGSRTIPFLSKAFDIDLAGMATQAMLGQEIPDWYKETATTFCVKQSTFPFDRFIHDQIILGPKMRSTGETFGMDADKDHAILKSYLGNYPRIKEKGALLLSLSDYSKDVILPYLKPLSKAGYQFYATMGTASYIKKQGIPCQSVGHIGDAGLSILEVLKNENLRIVLNTPTTSGHSKSDGEMIRNTAIQFGVPCFTRKENIKAVLECLVSTLNEALTPQSLQTRE